MTWAEVCQVLGIAGDPPDDLVIEPDWAGRPSLTTDAARSFVARYRRRQSEAQRCQDERVAGERRHAEAMALLDRLAYAASIRPERRARAMEEAGRQAAANLVGQVSIQDQAAAFNAAAAAAGAAFDEANPQ